MCCELNAPVIIWISHIASVTVERNKVAAVLKWKWVQNEWEKDNLKVKQKHLRERKKNTGEKYINRIHIESQLPVGDFSN